MHIPQPLNPYSDMKNLGNHNKDSTRFFIRSTNQYVALCAHDYLQDLGVIKFIAAFFSGSAAMMNEGVHFFMDTLNQDKIPRVVHITLEVVGISRFTAP